MALGNTFNTATVDLGVLAISLKYTISQSVITGKSSENLGEQFVKIMYGEKKNFMDCSLLAHSETLPLTD